MNRIATIVPDPEMFIFIDEAAKNKRMTGRSMGWGAVSDVEMKPLPPLCIHSHNYDTRCVIV
jgi:hypothetical protein